MFWMSMNQERIFGVAKKVRKNSEETEATAAASTDGQSEVGQSFWTRMGWKKMMLLVLNVCMITVGAVLCGLGLYASAKEIADSDVGKPFSCASNAPKSVAT